MLAIQKMLIKYNYSSGNNIKYLVIHDTGNSSAGATALMHYKYFNGGDRSASAHYFVDGGNIIQTVEDSNASWHCGDGHDAKGIGNHNSIGIEICINSDGNYAQAVQNTVDLVKYLMAKYGIDLAHVVRHYDASGKNCPGSMSGNNWARWNSFKASISGGSAFVVPPAAPQAGGNVKVQAVQHCLNAMGITDNSGNRLAEDGKYGPCTAQAVAKVLVKRGAKNVLVGFIQGQLGVKVDNVYGGFPWHGTYDALIAYQKNHGLAADGMVGPKTLNSLMGV